MSPFTLRLAFVTSLLSGALACSSGGGGSIVATDGGSRAVPVANDAAPDDRSDPSALPKDAGARTDAKKPTGDTYPLTCEGLCEKADVKLSTGCDVTKCLSQCTTRAQAAAHAAAGGCTAEWDTYLECAVLGGVIATCAFNGKIALAGCTDEESELTKCASKPKTCTRSCTTDIECQSTCPSSGSSIACCDAYSGVCYARNSSSCGI